MSAWDKIATECRDLEVWGEADPRVDESLALILPHLDAAKPGNVLEIGCGLGRLLVPVAQQRPSWRVWGLDISPAMLARVDPVPANVTLLVGDGASLPDTPPLDAIWSMVVFQHIPHDTVRAYLRAAAERLRPGGRLRFQVVQGTLDQPMHHHWGAQELFDAVEEAGLLVAEWDSGAMAPEWLWVTAIRP